ncbi:MAG TPA: hypothetical protein VGQ86_11540 [Candidatus Limnocylindria bacterium]|jgi:hypothetical protein|nr:hypothetical protein [Candidatus Limnocylindria bacterium]
MGRILLTGALALLLVGASSQTAWAQNPRVVVYVASQGLCYESIVAPNSLPAHGPFQLLTPSAICGAGTFMTDFGPGDPGYVGGRWVTLDGKRFSCPLVGPGFSPP